MFNPLNLIHYSHSGRFKSHEHTSYLSLGLILFITGFALTIYTVSADSPPPEPSSIGLTGVMPGEAPTVGATIDNPKSESRSSESPVKISGTCPENILVEIFKNDIFAGSTICSSEGQYSLEVDLLVGKNDLIAKVYDALNQPGPDSNLVVMYYDALPIQADPLTGIVFSGEQLLLNTDAVFRGVFPRQSLKVPITIIGGVAPFAVNIQWGDGENNIVSKNDNTSFLADHTYDKAGVYKITIQATDSVGKIAFLTVASIVNGQPVTTGQTNQTTNVVTNQLLLLWPLYASSVAVVISFFIGERREKYMLKKHGQLISQ